MKNTKIQTSSLRCALAGVALTLVAAPTWAGGVDLQLNIGVPVAPPPVYVAPAAPPAYVAPAAAPTLVWSPEYGAYIALDVGQPLLYIGGVYYFFNGVAWFSGPNYWGPWGGVVRMPMVLRRFHPRDWGHVQDMARGRMGDPHWRQFRPGPAPAERVREHGPDHGPEHGPGHERERDRP